MNRFLAIIIAIMMSPAVMGQIQPEHSTGYSGKWVDLEKEGSVFYTMDVSGEKCRIYKPGYQLWKTININVPNNQWLSDIQYVSQNLFNTDDDVEMLIVYYEYIQTTTSYYYKYTTQVINEKGNVLLNVPLGSYSMVQNTRDDGTKLLVYETDYSVYPYPVTTHIYSLPGVLAGKSSIASEDQFSAFSWPNPTDGNFTLSYKIPGQPKESWFILYNLEGAEVLREPLSPTADNASISRPDLPSGEYIYRLISPNYQSKGQKIIINK
jgi:hypothetical protein